MRHWCYSSGSPPSIQRMEDPRKTRRSRKFCGASRDGSRNCWRSRLHRIIGSFSMLLERKFCLDLEILMWSGDDAYGPGVDRTPSIQASVTGGSEAQEDPGIGAR